MAYLLGILAQLNGRHFVRQAQLFQQHRDLDAVWRLSRVQMDIWLCFGHLVSGIGAVAGAGVSWRQVRPKQSDPLHLEIQSLTLSVKLLIYTVSLLYGNTEAYIIGMRGL